MNGKTLALSLLLAGVLTAGCGRMGDLEDPGVTGDANTVATAPIVQPGEPGDENIAPAQPRTLPIDGGPSDPGKAPPQGALPDPYNNPQ